MHKKRQALIAEFIQSYKRTHQLFLKSVQHSMHNHAPANQACFPVLKVLHRHGSLSQHAIAQELLHSDAAVSRQISALLEKGYIRADIDTANRRSTIVSLTPSGEQALKEMEAMMNAHVERLLASMSDQRLAEIVALNNELQEIMITNLEKEGNE